MQEEYDFLSEHITRNLPDLKCPCQLDAGYKASEQQPNRSEESSITTDDLMSAINDSSMRRGGMYNCNKSFFLKCNGCGKVTFVPPGAGIPPMDMSYLGKNALKQNKTDMIGSFMSS